MTIPRRHRANAVRAASAANPADSECAEETNDVEARQLTRHWRTHFLEALAETSNVTRAAEAAGVPTGRAYRLRREDRAFAALWRAALHEGYEHLELETLAFLRSADPAHKLDVANAIRLMSMHREEVARHRAAEDSRSEQEVLDSIDAMIDEMRQRAAANSAAQTEPGA